MKKTDLQMGDVKQLATGFQFVEGPVWHPDGHWLFSDIPGNRINKVTPDGELTVHREPSGNSNGLTFDRTGRLVACEHGNRRVSLDNETLVDTFKGKRLNSPNDVVVHSSGAVYFTDPPYGIKPEEQEQSHNGVYRLAPDGHMTLLVADFERPNGLAFSPDESVLYIDDTQHAHVRAFDVTADGTLENDRLFADLAHDEPGAPDGLKIDQEGNVYTTNALGMWVHAPNGEFLGIIETPEVPANCAWGKDGHTLFMTARTSVYTVEVKIPGIAVL